MPAFRVLLVDDEPTILRALQRTLVEEGYHLFTASDASGALEILDREQIDMVIADQGMPGGSGLDLLKRIKLRYPWILRMMLTGQPGLTLARKAYQEAGTYRVLAKPWEADHLRNLVRCAHRQLELQASRELLRRSLLRRDAQLRADLLDTPGLGRIRRDEDGKLVFDDPVFATEEPAAEDTSPLEEAEGDCRGEEGGPEN